MSVTIREQSQQLKAAAAERLPGEVVAVFDQSIRDLLEQGVPSAALCGAGEEIGQMSAYTLRSPFMPGWVTAPR